MIPLSLPNISGNELKYVKECLETGWISTAGSYVDRFEKEFATYLGVNQAVSTMNGTSALHLALKVLGVSFDDLVVMPNITFVASANAISYLGAEPVLIDIDQNSWQMDLELLESYLENNCISRDGKLFDKKSSRKIAAIMIVHVQGNICDMSKLKKITEKYRIPLVEDAAEALGSKYNGQNAGTIADIGCYSFNGNKIISTGGGGMVVAKEQQLIDKLKHLSTTAKTDPLRYYHDEVGYNYRLVNILSAIGVAQLEQLQSFIARKIEISKFYRQSLDNVGDINFQHISNNVISNEWLFTITTSKMEPLLKYLNENEVMSRPFWVPMNQLPMYKNCAYISNIDASKKVHSKALSIPCSTGIHNDELDEVVLKIKTFFNN
tara:strand:+ start:19313 stop:20449 length:1137 start_codon:yes stop_codon:yes gene_type:complete